MRRVAILLIGALALGGADEKKPKPELPPAVRQMVELARGTAPEFFAQTIVELVSTGKIPDREARIDLLEEAFSDAQSAKEPYRLIAIPATPQDTRALHRSKAGELKLDALSLESRISREMLRIDHAKAREMFDEIARPELDPRPCEDPLVADDSAYYEMAAAIAQSTFTDAQKEKNAHVQFLEAVLDGAKSPGELLPFLETSRAVRMTPQQHELLTGAVAAKLESIGADYRAFAMTYDALKSAIDGMSAADQEALGPAFQDYAIAQASAARCEPDFGPKIYAGEDEVRPAKMLGEMKVNVYFQSGNSKQIGEELQQLRAAAGKLSWLRESGRDGPEGEWSDSLADFLRDYAAWVPEGENIDAFHQRATVLRALLDLTRRGEDRDQVIQASLDLLASAQAQQEYPEEWLYEVGMLTGGPRSDSTKMLNLFRASGDPALVLFALFHPN
ncbi:MAG TPA: hypothetical protein VMB85_24920 [Bryobacteraceae bacterium]|nr:hypothetical protein [Bryobacteraceae bacterium]